MARFPKIDSPCPLGIDEQRRINGYCQRCDKHVHSLDGMSDAQRAALLSAAVGPMCVSYRRGPRMASMAALAITLVAGSAFAAETCADTVAPSLLPASQQQASTAQQPALLPSEDEAPTELDHVVILGGGISDPQDAEWVDESDLPELPMLPAEPASGSRTR